MLPPRERVIGELVFDRPARTVATTDADLERRFVDFVAAHRERARRLAWRLVGGNDAAAEDVTQDALLKAWDALGRFREDAALETWFLRILVHRARSYRRWLRLRELWGGLADEDTPEAVSLDHGDAILRGRIAQALAGLSAGQREAFILVHLEGFSVKETSELLGKAEGTVKSHLHRALSALRTELGDRTTDVTASAVQEQGQGQES